MTTQQQIESLLLSLNEPQIEQALIELRKSDYFSNQDLAGNALAVAQSLLDNPMLDGYAPYDKVITGLFLHLYKANHRDWNPEAKTDGMRSVLILRNHLHLFVSESMEWAIRGYNIKPIDKSNLLWVALYKLCREPKTLEPTAPEDIEDNANYIRQQELNSIEWLPVQIDREHPEELIIIDKGQEKRIPSMPFQRTPEYINHLSRTFPCYRNSDGTLSQAIYPLFCQCFLCSRENTFSIVERKEKGYILSDLYGFQHLYNGLGYHEDEEMEMEVKKVIPMAGNKAQLKLSPILPEIILEANEDAYEESDTISRIDNNRYERRARERENRRNFYEDEPFLSLTESKTIEFKASFVYGYQSVIDIDHQMEELIQALAAFMNADGGKLYVGVRDNGSIKGLDEEFEYLSDPRYNRLKYHPNRDGFIQRLQSDMKFLLGQEALDYLEDIKFTKRSDRTYAVVKVRRAEQIIWCRADRNKENKNRIIYVRKFGRNECYYGGRPQEQFIMHRYRELSQYQHPWA